MTLAKFRPHYDRLCAISDSYFKTVFAQNWTLQNCQLQWEVQRSLRVVQRAVMRNGRFAQRWKEVCGVSDRDSNPVFLFLLYFLKKSLNDSLWNASLWLGWTTLFSCSLQPWMRNQRHAIRSRLLLTGDLRELHWSFYSPILMSWCEVWLVSVTSWKESRQNAAVGVTQELWASVVSGVTARRCVQVLSETSKTALMCFCLNTCDKTNLFSLKNRLHIPSAAAWE